MLTKVGITAEAFRNLSGPQALQLYYDTLVKAGASQQDLVFYLEAMASDATKLIPLLQDGGMRFKELGDQAERAGVIISTQTAQAALAFSSNLLQLGAVKDGIITKITAQLLPALELLSEKFLAVANDGEAIEAMSTGVIKALHFISNEVGQLALLSSRLSAEFAGISEAFSRLGSGDFSGAWAAFQEGQEASAAMAEKLRGQIDQIFDGVAVSQGAIQRRIDTAFGEIGVSAGKRFTESLAQNISSESAKKAIDPIVREAASIFDATRTPLENYQSQIARLNELLAAGAINQDTYNRAVIQAQDAFEKAENAGQKADKTFSQIGNSVASTFSNAFQGLLDGSKKVKDVLADLLKQLASMAMNRAFQSIFGAIFGGGGSDPWAGLRIPNFARGGTIMPGGGGGIDSQLVMFRKSPNERVDISKPNQTAAMGSESYAPIYNIDARGAQKGVGEEIAAALKAYDRGRLSRLAGDLPELRRRGGA